MLKVNLEKIWDTVKVEASFTQNKNEILSVIGPSGCGKTTLLNMISGIITGDNGEVIINDEIIFSKEKNINKTLNKREIGYIQQKDTLFPHLNVEKNILYGRRDKKYSIDINDILKVLEIKNILSKMPKELSGGQKQRVAIARALAAEPKLLLMDEPFSALDNIMRSKLKNVVKDIRDSFNMPIIFITHSLEEAYSIGDRVAIMKDGKILQIDYRDEIFNKPSNKEVASFIGIKNILSNDLGEKLLNLLGYDELRNECVEKKLNVCVWSEHIKLHRLCEDLSMYKNRLKEKNIARLKSKVNLDYKYNKCVYGNVIEVSKELNEINYKIKLININKLDNCSEINNDKVIQNNGILNSEENEEVILHVKVLGRVCKENSLKCGECVSIHIKKKNILMLK